MGVSGGLEGLNGVKMGGLSRPLTGGLTAVSEVVYMRKVGVRDEYYMVINFYVRWMRFCV